MLNKCRNTAVPSNLKEKTQVLIKKAAFPSRESTLKDLNDTVKALQMNVVVAIQALQLYVLTPPPPSFSFRRRE